MLKLFEWLPFHREFPVCTKFIQIVVISESGKTKVRYFDEVVAVNKDVACGKITMHDVLRCQVFHALKMT